jgi:Ca-activated chloride channel homolog
MNQLHRYSIERQGRIVSVIVQGCIAVLLLFGAHVSSAQVTRMIQNGNSLYGQKRYKEAAIDYAKVVAKNPTYTPGLFNLGNSLYQQKQYDSSRRVMQTTARVAKDKDNKAAANYNIGNTYMAQQKWEDAINSYKQTLRANPQDADAKYNLSYAEQMMKKEQKEEKDKKDKKDKDKDKKDDKDKDKDKDKKDDKDKDKKDDKDKQEKDQDKDKKDDKEEQQPKSQPSKLSQQKAEQLLNALQQEEKKLQEKMKKEKGIPVKMTQDW